MNKKIAIVGTGFMGISIAKSLKSLNENYIIYSYNRRENVSLCLKKNKIIDNYYSNYTDLIKDVDIIILTTPISSFSQIISSIKNSLYKQIIVDFGSTKEKVYFDIINILEEKQNLYVPCHPITGGKSIVSNDIENEINRISNNIYENKTVHLFPKNSNINNLNIIKNIFIKLKSNIDETLTIKEHDKVYALTSHLPIFIVAVFLYSINDYDKNTYYYFLEKFLDSMWIPIFLENINNISFWINQINNILLKNKTNIINSSILSSIFENLLKVNNFQNYIGNGFKKFISYKTSLSINFNDFINNQNIIIDICKKQNINELKNLLENIYKKLI